MIASTGPNGWYRVKTRAFDGASAGSHGWSARCSAEWSAYQRHPSAHLPTSAFAATKVLPISRVASPARRSVSASRMSAAARIHPARRSTVVSR